MKLLIKTLVITLSSVLLLASTAPVAMAVNSKNAVCEGIGAAADVSGCHSPAGSPTVQGTIRSVINILSLVVGVIAVVMIIVAGVRFVTSGGDAQKVAGARNSILYAVIGLVIVALAQVIARFVLTKTAKSI